MPRHRSKAANKAPQDQSPVDVRDREQAETLSASVENSINKESTSLEISKEGKQTQTNDKMVQVEGASGQADEKTEQKGKKSRKVQVQTETLVKVRDKAFKLQEQIHKVKVKDCTTKSELAVKQDDAGMKVENKTNIQNELRNLYVQAEVVNCLRKRIEEKYATFQRELTGLMKLKEYIMENYAIASPVVLENILAEKDPPSDTCVAEEEKLVNNSQLLQLQNEEVDAEIEIEAPQQGSG